MSAPTGAKATTVRKLEPARYAEWDALVERSPHGCIFHYSWWLNACGWPFEILVAEDGQGKVIAGIPLPQQRVAGLTLLYTPTLTPFLGPVFDLSGCSTEMERLGLMRNTGESLGQAMAGFDGVSQWVGANGPDLQGFLWAGFRVEISYTFLLKGTTLESIWQNADGSHRNHVRHAERTGAIVETSGDVDRFLRLNRLTFERQQSKCPWSDRLVLQLWDAASRKGAARLYLGMTSEGEDAAGIIVVNDAKTSYQLLAGYDPQLRASGAGNLVSWRAISDAVEGSRAYDFEGSELRGVESYFRHWGARPLPIWRLERAGTWKGALARLWHRRGKYRQRL